MLRAVMIVILLTSAAGAEDSPITVRGYPWAPFISPMGEPFRSTSEPPIARWFAQADRDRDGLLTEAEMLADADRFFDRLDENRDGNIDPQEVATYEYDVAPDVQVESIWKRRRGEAAPRPEADRDYSLADESFKRGDDHDGYRADGLQGAARYGLLNIPQPVAAADADFNRLVTLAEFRLAAAYRFKLLDTAGQDRLTLPELEARLPVRPKGKRAAPRKDPKDDRIGLPLPDGS